MSPVTKLTLHPSRSLECSLASKESSSKSSKSLFFGSGFQSSMASITMASPCLNPNISTRPFILARNSTNARDDSFSTYYALIRDNFPPELTSSAPNGSSFQISLSRKKPSEGELDVFDAKGYFSGRMDGDTKLRPENVPKVPTNRGEESSVESRSRTRSGNSQSTLLRDDRKYPLSNGERLANSKRFLGVFRCSCSRKDAVEVDRGARSGGGPTNGKKTAQHKKSGDRRRASWGRKEQLRRELRREKLGAGLREDAVAFPPNFNSGGGKVTVRRDLKEEERVRSVPKGVLKGGVDSSLGTSLTRLTSANPAGGGGRDDDLGSESSSDLFEIESIWETDSGVRTERGEH